MAHFAEIESNNIVIRVLVVDDTQEPQGIDFLTNELTLGGVWVQCSYNNNMRKQFPGIGYIYDQIADVFIVPKPFPSWSLNAQYDWQPPVPMPTDGKLYQWDETSHKWIWSSDSDIINVTKAVF